MRIAIYSNVFDARQGGGVLYIASLASALASKHQVQLFFPGKIDIAELQQYLPVSFSGIKTSNSRVPTNLSLFSEIREILASSEYDMIVTQSTQIPRLQQRRNSVLVCEFPMQKSSRLSERARLRIFRSIIANSSYTADWIERRWGRKAEVLHPAIFPIIALKKEPWILSVGRFLDGKRSKCQIEMVGMFREMVHAGLTGWQLHIAGMLQDEKYFQEVRRLAEGLPIVLHVDICRRDLEQLYGQASIFWHAAGMQCDPENEPECMEHFGIATAEAMSAGAVPVVINRGGQPEIVGKPECGILWSSIDECKEKTWNLTQDRATLQQMSARALERASAFHFSSFAKRVSEIFERAN